MASSSKGGSHDVSLLPRTRHCTDTECEGAAMSTGHERKLNYNDVKILLDNIQKDDTQRALKMPTEQDAINTMFEAWIRLKELGWRDASYCPKDGSIFHVIEPGSTGIFDCHYEGEWPKGRWWIHADNDLCPTRPIMFKGKP